MRAVLLAVWCVAVLAGDAPGQGKKAEPPPKVGETLIVGPMYPAVGAGYQLARTRDQAVHASELFKRGFDQQLEVVKECDGQRAKFLRFGTKVTLLTLPDTDGVAEMRAEEGPHRGESGFVNMERVGRVVPPSRTFNPKKYPDDVRRELFETHFLLLNRSLAEAVKKIDPKADRFAFETEAGKIYVRRADEIQKKIKISDDDWSSILRDGMARGWKYEYTDR